MKDFPDPRREKDFFLLSELRQAQLVMLRLLRIFDAICKKNNLHYWLDAGTLLGAVRHGGFIPWDDDVDVMMPIDDYKHFLEIAEKELPFDIFLQTKKTDSAHDISWAKLRDRYSYMDDQGGPYNYNQGIPIDIFPSYTQTKRQFKMRTFLSVLPPFLNPPEKPSKRFSIKHNIFNSVIGIVQHIFLFCMKIKPLQKVLLQWTEKPSANNIRGWTYNPERPWFQFFPDSCVFPLSTVLFEGIAFSSPHNNEEYLSIYYGDWHTPPPEGKRNVHNVQSIHLTDAGPKPHSTTVIWKELI